MLKTVHGKLIFCIFFIWMDKIACFGERQNEIHGKENPINRKELTMEIGELTEKINKQFPGPMYYRYSFTKTTYGNFSDAKETYEKYFQETFCRKDDAKTKAGFGKCDYNPNGKVIICGFKEIFGDISSCKTTGDSYIIPIKDQRTEIVSMTAVTLNLLYPPVDNALSRTKLSYLLTVTSPMEREVIPGGTRQSVRFSTSEQFCNDNNDNNENCILLKPRMDCEVTVLEKFEVDSLESVTNIEQYVKCVQNKDPKEIAAMAVPYRSWKACYKFERQTDERKGIETVGCFVPQTIRSPGSCSLEKEMDRKA